MTDAVNNISTATGTITVPTPVRAPAAAVDSTSAAAQLKSSGPTLPAALTGRLIDDPLASIVIQQQLDSEGHVVSQTPSSSVLAYLRNGLTIDGYPKNSKTA